MYIIGKGCDFKWEPLQQDGKVYLRKDLMDITERISVIAKK